MANTTQDLKLLTSYDSERAVIKLLLNHNDLFLEIGGRINGDYFNTPAHREIYNALAEMYSNNEPIDITTLGLHLDKSGAMNRIGGPSQLMRAFDVIVTNSSFEQHLDMVREMAHRRFLYQLGINVQENVYDLTTSVSELESGICDYIEKLNTVNKSEVLECKDVMMQAYDSMMASENFGLTTRFFELDSMTRGFNGGELIILAGRPAMGKTAFALNLVANVCKQDKSVLMLSLEMSAEELMKRVVFSLAGENNYTIGRQKAIDRETHNSTVLTEKEKAERLEQSNKFWAKINKAMDVAYKWKFGIIESGSSSVKKLAVESRIRRKKQGLDLIVIDYLQLMSAKGYKDNRVQEISAITRQLKLLAKEMNIPIILLSQLSRGVESRNDKRPLLSDLRESGSIEQDADKVFMMYRDAYYNEPADPWAELILAKNRNGVIGTIKLEFLSDYTKFIDWDEKKHIEGKEVKTEGRIF